MVPVKAALKGTSAALTRATGPEGQDYFLAFAEEALHLLIQYSVRRISRIGRLAGGTNFATWFTRASAAM